MEVENGRRDMDLRIKAWAGIPDRVGAGGQSREKAHKLHQRMRSDLVETPLCIISICSHVLDNLVAT